MQLSQVTLIAQYLNSAHKTFKHYSFLDLKQLQEHVAELKSVVDKLQEFEANHVSKPVLMSLPDSNFRLNEVVAMIDKRLSQEVEYAKLQQSLFPDTVD